MWRVLAAIGWGLAALGAVVGGFLGWLHMPSCSCWETGREFALCSIGDSLSCRMRIIIPAVCAGLGLPGLWLAMWASNRAARKRSAGARLDRQT